MPPELPPSRTYEVIGKFMSVPHLGLIWWLALSLLDDRFRLGVLAWSGMLLTCAVMMRIYLGHVGLLPQVSQAFQYVYLIVHAVLVSHIMWTCFSGFRDDLIKVRRILRLWMAVLPTLILLFMIVSEYIFESYYVIKLVRVILTLPAAVFWLVWLTRFQVSQLVFAPPETTEPERPKITARDRAAHARLLQIMDNEKAYLETDLSVGKLAERVGVPAHQLRALINRGMGFRNFSQFLASYRIADIKAALADPEQARVPILTLALNGGFSSLTTFNRTFRAETGQSAGEFRKTALGAGNQS